MEERRRKEERGRRNEGRKWEKRKKEREGEGGKKSAPAARPKHVGTAQRYALYRVPSS